MLVTSNVKVIKSEDKKTYKAYALDVFNFEHASTDPIQDYEPKVDGKTTVLLDGTEFKGTQPKNELPAQTDDASVDALLTECFAYCEAASQAERTNKKGEVIENPYTKDGAPIPNAGKLFALSCITEANTAHLRLALDAANRDKSVDPAAARATLAASYVRKGTFSDLATAYKKIARNEAADLVVEAEDRGEDLSMKDAMLLVSWYQDMLKTGK